MTHLTREQLIEWRDRPDAAVRAEVVAHLAVCDECAALCAELVRTRPAETMPARFAPADFAPRAYALHRRHRVKRARLGSLIPIGAAALLAIVVLVPLLRESDRTVRTDVPRPITIGKLSPSGDVDGLVDFSWEASAPAYNYRVDVKDARGAVLLSRTTATPPIQATPDVWVRFKPNRTYSWTVTALDSSGEAIVTSAPQEFTIREPR